MEPHVKQNLNMINGTGGSKYSSRKRFSISMDEYKYCIFGHLSTTEKTYKQVILITSDTDNQLCILSVPNTVLTNIHSHHVQW